MPAEKKAFIRSVIDKYNEEIPVLIKKSCIKCGECADELVCRERAVIFYPQKYPKFDLRKCNSCFRCIDFCNYAAITRGKSLKKLVF
jgi:MinD superfamily P-loop ATPase